MKRGFKKPEKRTTANHYICVKWKDEDDNLL